MDDRSATVQSLKDAFGQFVSERQWEQFHSPKNLAMGLAIEAAELMEHFLWIDGAASREAVKDAGKLGAVGEEIADVAGFVLCLCNVLGLDLHAIVHDKLAKNAVKYPADQYRGRFEL
jgi:NTP pyrophosphatase (non-canonical NTP hydrolase)